MKNKKMDTANIEEENWDGEQDFITNKISTRKINPKTENGSVGKALIADLMLRMDLDQVNRVETFEEIGMADPFRTKKSL